MNPNMFARVILASRPVTGAPRLYTIHARYPRIIHGEVLTHRKKSRNARSSRAVPVNTMLNEVKNDPFVPWHWGKNQKGMQAAVENYNLVTVPTFNGACEDLSREDAWLRGRDFAVMIAEGFMEAEYHKQVANRIIEPYSWIDTLITSTSWANFFHLRDHKDAEPHFQDLARCVKRAIEDADLVDLEPGEWHLPYIDSQTIADIVDYLRNGIKIMPTDERILNIAKKVSTARCARISYRPFNGDSTIASEVQRHDDLVASDPLHASPTEHQATPDKLVEGWDDVYENEHLAGNLGNGWVQYRKTLPNEYIEDAA